ncbi:hypothetical protein FNV43_RR13392 [Rhamnella rubrinervis]|uniref:FBD domain-containing protein n=1 Tax=Rhamnella rubrinervis TaxID=2594499 RepID=A0A8K0H0Z1_9ROSA|nr:hypothetical protein FNV43_RR13392 [Rhamnella rubrinervis]
MAHDFEEIYSFCEFVDRFMSLHNGVDLHQFDLLFIVYCESDLIDVGFRVGTWILQATRSNVERICLELNQVPPFTLPVGVWNCAFLRELELNLHTGTLILPNTSVSRIEILTLKRLRVSVDLLGKLILSCKWLKKLHLYDVYGFDELNINSSLLEHLQIDNFCLNGDGMKLKVSADRLKYLSILYKWGGVDHSLRLHAPRLERFYWSGNVFNYSYEGDFGSLKHADISIIPSPNFGDEYEAAFKRIMVRVLETVYGVSSLCVSDLAIKELSLSEVWQEFCNLRSLTLISKDLGLGNTIPSMVSLLNSTPYLDTLEIRLSCLDYSNDEDYEDSSDDGDSTEMISSYNAEYWEAQNLKFVDFLKNVEMEIDGEQNEIDLIKYLLKNAKELEKMTIFYSSNASPRLSVISRKLQHFQKVSSSIVFKVASTYGFKVLVSNYSSLWFLNWLYTSSSAADIHYADMLPPIALMLEYGTVFGISLLA